MERAKVIRGLRIAVSAVCGILCVLLIVLWVRSYWWHSYINWRNSAGGLNVSSYQGVVDILRHSIPTNAAGWSIMEEPANKWAARTNGRPPSLIPRVVRGPAAIGIQFPYWLLMLVTAAVAALPWVKSRFSLRTLLIATTLVALLLGLVVSSIAL
jgi:hypothetical protein